MLEEIGDSASAMPPMQVVEGPVRVAVVGAGFWAVSNHIPQLSQREDVELVAVCRKGEDDLRLIADRFGFKVASEDYREAIDAGVDAAIISSPNTLHHEHAVAALERGLHVMVEKPLAPTAAQSWEIVELARRGGIHALVPHGWHYKPFVQRAKELLDGGGVGEIRHVLCHMASPTLELFEGRGGYGTVELGGTRFEAAASTWADPRRAGGYALGQLTHALGLLAWLTGLRARTVSACETASSTGVDVVEAAVVEFDGGAVASVSGCGLVPAHCGFQLDLRIFGAEGMLLLDVERERCELRRHDRADEVEVVPPGEGAYDCDVPPHRFIELVRGLSDRNDSPAEAAARAVEIAEGLLRSASLGESVEVAKRGES